MKQYVVTISRQFGSLGRTIAQQMAKELQIEYLDRDIVEATAKRMELPVSVISEEEESLKTGFFIRKYPLGMGIPSLQDEIFEVQSNLIRDFAAKESCIIVGRCGDSVLKDVENRLNIYVYAPYEARIKNCTESLGMDVKTAKRMIKEVDKAREHYLLRHCLEVHSIFDNKDLMIDSSRFGVEKTAKMLSELTRVCFK